MSEAQDVKILHVVPGLSDPTNGIAVAAKFIAGEQSKSGAEVEVVDTKDFLSPQFDIQHSTFFVSRSEVWVHSMWLPQTMRACWKVVRGHGRAGARPFLVRMPHGCMDPVKVGYHWWKKMWVWPFEKILFRLADRVVVTEADERLWAEAWCETAKIQLLDLGSMVGYCPREGLGRRKFLFIGRMHPLKGVGVLIAAVRQLKDEGGLPADFSLTIIGRDEKEMRSRLEAEAVKHGLPIRFLGEVDERTKRAEMSAADCLVLPTLSENFGLVVKESLELGVPVITTDGAKIWKGHAGVTYLDGFVAATDEVRVKLLKEALSSLGSCRRLS